METVSTGSPERSKAAGLPASQIPDSFRTIYREVTDQGAGPHTLTGPVFIEEAEPGDALEVRIRKIEVDYPFACNSFRPGTGFLPDDSVHAHQDHPAGPRSPGPYFADGIFGSIGAAPPDVTETRASML